jgi:hypothetical protein
MRSNLQLISVIVAAGLLGLATGTAVAQQKGGGIVCWKDKSGKVIGCGDKVPPEYQDNANKVLNQRGIIVKQSDAALTPEQKQAQAAAAEQKKIDEQKRDVEARHDRALLDSFTNEKEIDLKRTRDIQQTEVNISAQQSNLKNTTDRQNEVKTKLDQIKREGKPVPAPLQEDFDRLEAQKLKIQAQILQKRKEIVERNQEYDAMKKRFMELKGGAAVPTTAAPAAPAAAAAPAVAGGTPKK